MVASKGWTLGVGEAGHGLAERPQPPRPYLSCSPPRGLQGAIWERSHLS